MTSAESSIARKTAQAADILGVDKDLAKQFRETAAKLRQSLPNDGEKYVPYEGSKDYSIGSVGGFYPYPVLDPNNQLAKKPSTTSTRIRQGRQHV